MEQLVCLFILHVYRKSQSMCVGLSVWKNRNLILWKLIIFSFKNKKIKYLIYIKRLAAVWFLCIAMHLNEITWCNVFPCMLIMILFVHSLHNKFVCHRMVLVWHSTFDLGVDVIVMALFQICSVCSVTSFFIYSRSFDHY